MNSMTDAAERMDEAAEKVQRLLEAAKTEACDTIVNRAAGELPYAINRLVVQRFKLTLARYALLLVAVVLVGMVAGWWLRSVEQGRDEQCADQAGGRYCYHWVIPPRGN